MASGLGLDILQDSGKFPCAVCRTGVGRSSILCSKCNLWVHYKKCSGLKTLSEDLSYECPRCRGVPGVRPVDGRPFKEVEVSDCVFEAVDRFCYLGDMLSAGGGCMAAATARCRCAWGKFRENLPFAKCTIRWPLSVSLMVKIFFHSWEFLLLLSINHKSQPHTGENLELNLVWFMFYDSFS